MTDDKLATLPAAFADADFLLLSEVGHGAPPVLPGYQRFGAYRPAAAPRGAGRGLGRYVYVRNSLACRCRLDATSVLCHWVLVRDGAGAGLDLYLGCIYAPPASSPQWGGAADAAAGEWARLRSQILAYQQRGRVLMLGDFNARVGALKDFEPGGDELLQELGAASLAPSCQGVPTQRTALEGEPVNPFGKMLIGTCLSTGCVILNGRAPGPAGQPAWTFERERSGVMQRSCVDYGVIDARAFSLVTCFAVVPHGGFSDHNILLCKLRPPAPPAAAPRAPPAACGRPRPRWDESRREEFVAALEAGEAASRLAELRTQARSAPAAAARGLAVLLHEVGAQVFGVHEPRTRPDRGRGLPAWLRGCRRDYFNLQDALYRGDPDSVRAARNVLTAQKRRERRRLLARRQDRLLGEMRGNPRRFWAGYKADKEASGGGFTMEELRAHWSALLGGEDRGALPEAGAADPRELAQQLAAESGRERLPLGRLDAARSLNNPLAQGEVEAAMRKARGGAAAGLDGIGADLLKGAWKWVDAGDGKRNRVNILAPALTEIMGHIFQHGDYPDDWNVQPLSSVSKPNGGASGLANCRPIQCQCALAKVLHIVVQRRLDAFAESQGLRAEGQAGFMAGRRTSDHVFILRHLIDRARLRPGRRSHLFCCFVDFEKAYDSVQRLLLFKYLASLGITGHMLLILVQMYWRVRVQPKLGQELGDAFESTCGVRQGDPLSPLLFGLFIDRLEGFLATEVPASGVELGGHNLRLLLYADDLALLAEDASSLQAMLDALHRFCEANHLRVNVKKTEIVVFGAGRWRPAGSKGPASHLWRYNGASVPVSEHFKYLGITLHCTRGMSAAIDRLRAAGLRAIWGMHGRCKRYGIVDFGLRARLFRTLAEPILTYCSEVWAPGLMPSRARALRAPLQVLQNDYVRHLGGVRRCVPADILTSEIGLPPLPRCWVRACGALWNRLARMQDCPLKRAWVADLHLAHSLGLDLDAPDGRKDPARKTWSGAWLRVLHWLSASGGRCGAAVQAYLQGTLNTLAQGPAATAGMRVHLPEAHIVGAWDELTAAWAAETAQREGAWAEYCAAFAPVEGASGLAEEEEPHCSGFPTSMPCYIRHTARFNSHAHARALMRLRCCSAPCAASATSFRDETACPHCGVPETPEHVLLDCPAHNDLRLQPRFAPLFQTAAPPLSTFRAFVSQPRQYSLAEFTFLCFERIYPRPA